MRRSPPATLSVALRAGGFSPLRASTLNLLSPQTQASSPQRHRVPQRSESRVQHSQMCRRIGDHESDAFRITHQRDPLLLDPLPPRQLFAFSMPSANQIRLAVRTNWRRAAIFNAFRDIRWPLILVELLTERLLAELIHHVCLEAGTFVYA